METGGIRGGGREVGRTGLRGIERRQSHAPRPSLAARHAGSARANRCVALCPVDSSLPIRARAARRPARAARLVTSDAGVVESPMRRGPRLAAVARVARRRRRGTANPTPPQWRCRRLGLDGSPGQRALSRRPAGGALEWRGRRRPGVTDTEAGLSGTRPSEANRLEKKERLGTKERGLPPGEGQPPSAHCPRGRCRAASAHHGKPGIYAVRQTRKAETAADAVETRRRGRAGTSRRRPSAPRARPQRVAAPRRHKAYAWTTRLRPGWNLLTAMAREPPPGAVGPGRRRLPGSHDGKRGRGADRRAR